MVRDNRPYVAKIDVEGYEPVILEEAHELLRSNPPKAIIFEFRPKLAALSESPVFRMLSDLGMAIYAIPRSLQRPTLVECELSASTIQAHDYLTVPKSRRDWLLKRLTPWLEP